MNFAWNARLPRNIQECLHVVNLRHGTDGFTSPPKEGVLRIFSPWKIRRLRPVLNPRTWVPKASTLPLDHRSRCKHFLEFVPIYQHQSVPQLSLLTPVYHKTLPHKVSIYRAVQWFTLGTTDAHRHSFYHSRFNGPHACTNKYNTKAHFSSMVTFQKKPFRACFHSKQTPCTTALSSAVYKHVSPRR